MQSNAVYLSCSVCGKAKDFLSIHQFLEDVAPLSFILAMATIAKVFQENIMPIRSYGFTSLQFVQENYLHL